MNIEEKLDLITISYLGLQLDRNISLRNQGFDSLDLVEIIIEVEKDFNIKIEDNEINTHNTLFDLQSLIESKL